MGPRLPALDRRCGQRAASALQARTQDGRGGARMLHAEATKASWPHGLWVGPMERQPKTKEKEEWAGGGKKLKGVKKGWREKEKEIIKKRKLIIFFS